MYLKQWEAEATVFVNGQLLIGEVTLNHGDRVIFGGSHYFRSVPSCVSCGDFTSVSLIAIPNERITDQLLFGCTDSQKQFSLASFTPLELTIYI